MKYDLKEAKRIFIKDDKDNIFFINDERYNTPLYLSNYGRGDSYEEIDRILKNSKFISLPINMYEEEFLTLESNYTFEDVMTLYSRLVTELKGKRFSSNKRETPEKVILTFLSEYVNHKIENYSNLDDIQKYVDENIKHFEKGIYYNRLAKSISKRFLSEIGRELQRFKNTNESPYLNNLKREKLAKSTIEKYNSYLDTTVKLMNTKGNRTYTIPVVLDELLYSDSYVRAMNYLMAFYPEAVSSSDITKCFENWSFKLNIPFIREFSNDVLEQAYNSKTEIYDDLILRLEFMRRGIIDDLAAKYPERAKRHSSDIMLLTTISDVQAFPYIYHKELKAMINNIITKDEFTERDMANLTGNLNVIGQHFGNEDVEKIRVKLFKQLNTDTAVNRDKFSFYNKLTAEREYVERILPYSEKRFLSKSNEITSDQIKFKLLLATLTDMITRDEAAIRKNVKEGLDLLPDQTTSIKAHYIKILGLFIHSEHDYKVSDTTIKIFFDELSKTRMRDSTLEKIILFDKKNFKWRDNDYYFSTSNKILGKDPMDLVDALLDVEDRRQGLDAMILQAELW